MGTSNCSFKIFKLITLIRICILNLYSSHLTKNIFNLCMGSAQILFKKTVLKNYITK